MATLLGIFQCKLWTKFIANNIDIIIGSILSLLLYYLYMDLSVLFLYLKSLYIINSFFLTVHVAY